MRCLADSAGDAGLFFVFFEVPLGDAQTALAKMYEAGKGVPQDFKLAASWYRKAAEQGNVWGQYFLAQCIELAKVCAKTMLKRRSGCEGPLSRETQAPNYCLAYSTSMALASRRTMSKRTNGSTLLHPASMPPKKMAVIVLSAIAKLSVRR